MIVSGGDAAGIGYHIKPLASPTRWGRLDLADSKTVKKAAEVFLGKEERFGVNAWVLL